MTRDESRDIYVDLPSNEHTKIFYAHRHPCDRSLSNDMIARGYLRVCYVPHDQLEAAERELAELKLWQSLATPHFEAVERELDVTHMLLEGAEKRIAELEAELKEANARLATVSPQAAQELALAARTMAIPRCKDGCEHWNPGDSEIGLPYCQHDFGLIGPQEDGSSFCPYHSRLKK